MTEAKTEDKKKKFALYVRDSSLDVARQWYEQDNCASISEFIEKAILFYGGYVANERNQNYLPNIVISTLKSIMRDSENRHNRNLYRIALELSMLMNVMAATHHIPEESLPKHIQKRATNSNSSFKGNVDSSNADYSFNYVGTSDKLFVFEAPIDMLAYITLFKSNWEDHSYVALCSTAECAAVQMLKNYPNITNVYLCLDHDSAGIEGAIRLADILHGMGNYTLWRAMPKYKDWDEDLKALRGRDAIPSSEHLGLENIKKRCAELFETDVEDDEIYIELLGSKGYLLEQTFGKLRCLLEKIESAEDTEQRQELLFRVANTAVAYCFCRDWQMNNSCGIDKYTELIKKEYKPYRDKQRSCDQLEDLKQYLASLEKEMKATDTFTDQECCEQNKKMCRLGMLAIRLDGTIGRERDAELAKAQAQELAM